MRIGIDGRLKNESGVGRYIRNLVKHLAKINDKNEYILFSKKEDIADWKVKNDNWKIKVLNYQWHSIKEQLFAPAVMLKEKLNLVHFPYFNAPIFYPKKFIITIHDLIIDHFPTGRASTLNPVFYSLKRSGYKLDMNLSIYKASHIIVPSQATYEELINHYSFSKGKTSVIYEGADFDQVDNLKFDLKLKIKPKQYFFYIGNAYPHKNLEKLIKSFEKVISDQDYRHLKLVFAGKEDYFYKRLKQNLEGKSIEKSVVFFGYATNNELKQLYQNAIALIFPSFMEGFGLPALEAMKNHCLVLASDIPALREICKDCALYFKPTNESELIKLMKKTINNEVDFKEKIKCGLKQADKFSWGKMAEQTLKIYENSISL